jgi:hypothetical protein
MEGKAVNQEATRRKKEEQEEEEVQIRGEEEEEDVGPEQWREGAAGAVLAEAVMMMMMKDGGRKNRVTAYQATTQPLTTKKIIKMMKRTIITVPQVFLKQHQNCRKKRNEIWVMINFYQKLPQREHTQSKPPCLLLRLPPLRWQFPQQGSLSESL